MTDKIEPSLAEAVNRSIVPIDANDAMTEGAESGKKPEDVMEEANAMVNAITQISNSLFNVDKA